ncbi:MAG: VWA domain-containing protein [Planctomycetes bacterium]|nr:VWA domain-containing protein [Planctomycetota bacterium]
MFLDFFADLRAEGIPVSPKEYLTLLAALSAGLHELDVDSFYRLARCSLVKSERHYDRFDRVFARRYRDLAATTAALAGEVPAEWLEELTRLALDPERLRSLEDDGRSLAELLETFRRRLAEQEGRHEGGSKWIGTAGRSPFGHGGFAPGGIRVGGRGGARRAAKVWERREFRNLDGEVELDTRNFKVALRRLRNLVREGRAEEFDLDGTIAGTARRGGLLDLVYRPERKNRVHMVMLLDVGGSMDAHVEICERLFSAARAEIAGLEHYYFHNSPYETLWRDLRRRPGDELATVDLLARLRPDHRLVLVGDAAMNPYELLEVGGSIEHMNAESGETWLTRILAAVGGAVWLNPEPPERWTWTASTRMIQSLMAGRMFELTLDGLDRALRELMRRGGAPSGS